MSTPATPTDQPISSGALDDPNQTLSMMLQMQQQQMNMQQQITQLLGRLNPASHGPPPHVSQTQSCKPTRPIIEADCTDNKWAIFKDTWLRYKQMARLTGPAEIRNELRSSCSPAVNELLFNFVGPDKLNRSTEEELLTHIRSVAVKAVHSEVYRQQFFRLKQSDGESITHFVSRLKSQAMLCDFTQTCHNAQCETSYSANMITSQLIAGLYNQSHQSKVLSEVGSLKTLPQLVERLLTLEATAQAASHFQPASNICPVKSDYQKNKQTHLRQGSESSDAPTPKCNGCGKRRHGQGRKQCPAQGRKCNNCGKMNHFAAVCKSTSSNAAISMSDSEHDDTSFISTVTNPPPL